MKKAILATKVGMTQIFNEDGSLTPVTVLQAGPCVCLLYTSMGANAGGPHNVEQQTQIVKATLEQLVEIQTPGKIVPLPFEYVAKI